MGVAVVLGSLIWCRRCPEGPLQMCTHWHLIVRTHWDPADNEKRYSISANCKIPSGAYRNDQTMPPQAVHTKMKANHTAGRKPTTQRGDGDSGERLTHRVSSVAVNITRVKGGGGTATIDCNASALNKVSKLSDHNEAMGIQENV